MNDQVFLQPEKRKIGMVFQDYALFPHLSIANNIGFGLDKSVDKQKRVQEMLQLVDLADYEQRYPHELSGGQQQRIAIARALAPAPPLMLLDEPFSNLDESLKGRVRTEIRSILKATETTAIFVTHDLKDALAVADRVLVMEQGKYMAYDTPETLYNSPPNTAVANLFGHLNIVPATVQQGKAKTALGTFEFNGALKDSDGMHVQVTIPINALRIDTNTHTFEVQTTQFMGSHFEITVKTNEVELTALHSEPLPKGTKVGIQTKLTSVQSIAS